MGRRGKPPAPAALRKLRGTRDWRRPKGDEPKVTELARKDAPESLHKFVWALECWKELHPILTKMKVLTKADETALAGLCMAFHRARQADEAVSTYGIVSEDKLTGGLHSNPAVKISQSAWSEVRKFCQEFGLTPSARTRVRATDGQDPVLGDEKPGVKGTAEDFLFGGRKRDGYVAGRIGA